ncbi:hypothetical protein ACIO13_34710 [Streptomyces sp. NPDC087425]|uniref:hypothetical protein n=1 Tax=Streptomyces sp. NPDC087425 TaxID=3365787 RepID=UPI0038092110
MRRDVPQGQPNSGWGHWFRRAQEAQGTVIQSSSHTRWVITSGAPAGSSGGAVGAPHAHG